MRKRNFVRDFLFSEGRAILREQKICQQRNGKMRAFQQQKKTTWIPFLVFTYQPSALLCE